MERHDTIAAIATASGAAGVAIVRVSGPDAFALAERLTGRPASPGRIAYRAIHTPDERRELLDEGVVLAFRAPRSYTGEDVVEFQCHGGSVTPRRILNAAFAAGARLARRGEFTERAFLNGRLDYHQAESVLDLIQAKTDRAADAALEGLSGRTQQAARALYDKALSLSSTLEYALDVDESELDDAFYESVGTQLEDLRATLRQARVRAREGRILRNGALVVLAGAPNAGKSSLMNALLGESRAIVSATPGTTRDTIEEGLDLAGWPIRLVDTAGLRTTGDAVEAEGVARAQRLIDAADVILYLQAADLPNEESPLRADARTICVSSKCDLKRGAALNLSTRTGEGLDALKAAIVARLKAKCAAATTEAVSADDRALSVLVAAEERLASLSPRAELVVQANVLRKTTEELGELLGASYSADLLDRLFSRFCVGK